MGTTSNKSVATRLAIRPGDSVYVVGAGTNYAALLGRLTSGARMVQKAGLPADRVVVFAADNDELDRLLPAAIQATKPDGALWVAYPKLTSGKSDLSRQVVHDSLRLSDWKPVAQISIDDVWSAVRARPVTAADRR
jgi:hypothetical protein